MKNAMAVFFNKITGGVFLGTLLFSLSLPQARAVDVLTHLNDNNRSGANTNETILAPSNVNQSQFGQLWSYSVNGSTYAEPLYVSGVSIGGGTHNVVYIVTMEDDVYAFDADSNVLYWHVSFVGGNITPCPIVAIDGTDTANIVGDVGIESTPYIDKAGGTIYLLARTLNTSTTNFIQTLHALDITTGAEKFGGPTNIVASGFNPQIQNQRMGLAKAGNNIIIAWASHEDMFAYHGWVMAYNATNLAQVTVFNDTPSGTLGGIWQQGRAPAVDSSGNVYMITGNGTWDGTSNFGESMLKLSSSLSILDWFTPDNYNTLTEYDEDFGSGGAMLIPGTSLVIGGGKDQTLYVCNTGNMGHEQSGNGQVVQSISDFASGEIHAGPVWWNSATNGQLIFDCGNGDSVKSFKFNGSTIGTSPFQTASAASGGDPGGFLSVSANGNSNGIVWAAMETSDSDQGTRPGIVRAYNADNIGGTELWDSYQNPIRDGSGTFVKDANPMVANGKVYVGSYDGMVHVYGLLNLTSIILANYSFETNSSGGAASPPKTTNGFSAAAGWLNAGSTYVNSGLDYAGDAGNIAEQGSVVAYAKTGDPGAYQISGYQMQTGNQLTLTWWAKASAGAAGQTVSLMSAASPTSAFSSLTTLTNSTATLNQTGNGGAFTQYTLTYIPTPKDAGRYVAVFFAASATPTNAWATFDDFTLSVQMLNFTSFNLANYSFETNSSGGAASPPKTTDGFGAVAGWQNAGSTYNNSGVDYAGDAGNIAEDGTVLAFAETGDPGAYQISGYQMQTGDPVTLTWWAKASAGAAGQNVSLMSAASPTTPFSSLTTLTNSTATLNQTGNGGAYYPYSLTYTPTSADAGKYAAVFFSASATPASAWATFDNFGLWIQSNSVPSVTNGIYNIVNLNSGLLADVWRAGTTNGTPVNQYTNNGGANQEWGVTNVGGGIYKIIGVPSGLALDVVGSGTANGTLIDIWPYNSTYLNQQWTFTPTSGGYYRLTPQNATGSCLDVQHSGLTNDTPLEIWTYGGGNSQQWKLQVP